MEEKEQQLEEKKASPQDASGMQSEEKKIPLQEASGITFGTMPPEPTMEAIDGIRFDFNDGIRIRFPKDGKSYRLRFVDLDHKCMLYDTIAPPGSLATSLKKYYIRFRIVLSEPDTDKLLWSHDFDAKGKKVVVRFPVHTLGDTIAWFSYVERFQQKLGCKLYCVVSPWFAEIVAKQYPDITFISKEEAAEVPSYANYNIGLYEIGNTTHQPIDHRYVGLHKVAARILGVDEAEIPPRYDLSAPRQIADKYVCIGVQSTGLAKLWNNPLGWLTVVDWLKKQGLRVLCIDKERFTGKGGTFNHIPAGAEDFTGAKPLQERINLLKDAECFIGLSSGLSWLAWGCKIPVVVISGFTNPINEWSNPYRIINYNVCNSCWNDFKDFKLSDYWHCPRHQGTDQQFECTAHISADYVIDTLKKCLHIDGNPATNRTNSKMSLTHKAC